MEILIDISNQEGTGFPRKARLSEFKWAPASKAIVINVDVELWANDAMGAKEKTISLVATNEKKVNAQGESVPAYILNEEGVEVSNPDAIGEYDFFMYLASNPVNIFDIIRAEMQNADAKGKYN